MTQPVKHRIVTVAPGRYLVPAQGLSSLSFFFGLLAAILIGIPITLLLLGIDFGGSGWVGLGATLFLGLLALAKTVDLARTTTCFEVIDDHLQVTSQRLLSRSVRTWPAQAVRRVSRQWSGIKVRRQTQFELRVETESETGHFLLGEDEPELEWLAAELSRELKLVPVASE